MFLSAFIAMGITLICVFGFVGTVQNTENDKIRNWVMWISLSVIVITWVVWLYLLKTQYLV